MPDHWKTEQCVLQTAAFQIIFQHVVLQNWHLFLEEPNWETAESVLNCSRDWMRRILNIWYFQRRRVALGTLAIACFRLKRKWNLVFCAKRQATPQLNMGSCCHSFGVALAGALWRWVWDLIPRQETCAPAHSMRNLAPFQAVAKFPLISAMPGFHISVPLCLFIFFPCSPLSVPVVPLV